MKLAFLLCGLHNDSELGICFYMLLIGTIPREMKFLLFMLHILVYMSTFCMDHKISKCFLTFLIVAIFNNWESSRLQLTINTEIQNADSLTRNLLNKTRFIATLTHEMRNIVTRYFSTNQYKKAFYPQLQP